MIFERIYQLATARKFVPFTVQLRRGMWYRVPTRDHIFFIRDDEGQAVSAGFEIATDTRVHYVPTSAVTEVELACFEPRQGRDS